MIGRRLGTIAMCGALLCMLGCASPSGGTYSRSDAGMLQTVSEGEVVMVRHVVIEGSDGATAAGAVAGGALGYAVGRTLFKGSARHLARAGTTVAGASIGASAGQSSATQQALEITVRLEDGRAVSVVQPAEVGREFRIGDEVKLMVGANGSARIVQ